MAGSVPVGGSPPVCWRASTALARILEISTLTLGVAVLAAATSGCTRTSDGSYVMRRPAMLNRIIPPREHRVAVASLDAGPAVYEVQQSAPPPSVSPRVGRKLPTVSMPSMSIARNPPFKLADPDKPLSCYNETSATGRIRVVCM